MRVPRVFIDTPLPESGEVTLNDSTSHYLIKVLRMEAGRELTVFNGDGNEYDASITLADKRACAILVSGVRQVNRESPLRSHLAIGVSRGERMDWVLQKATELGASEITPLFSERTEVKLKGERLEKKTVHWQQVLVSACEQCQRNVLPRLNPATDLQTFLTQQRPGLKLVLHHRSERRLASHTTPEAVTLLIGPEGGLSDEEITAAEGRGYYPLSLGPRVLRTETAPLVALTALQLLWGDL